MAVAKHTTAVKRFGPRYGNIVKQKFSMIESQQRSLYKCPYCSKVAVKRLATGIWHCGKCDAKFANKAYTVTKKKSLKESVEEQPILTSKEENKETAEKTTANKKKQPIEEGE